MTEPYGIVLLRVSDFDQTTIPEQLVMTKQQAATMAMPIPEDGVYVDQGDSRSAYLTREGLQDALVRANDPWCKYVFVWQFTRMIGSIEQYLDITKQLRRCDVTLMDADGTVHNAPDHNAKLTGIINAWQSEGEVILLRKRVRDTHNVKANAGRLISRPPFGVKVVPILSLPCKGAACVDGGRGCTPAHSSEVSKKNDTVWVVDPVNIEHVRLMFNWAAQGVSMYSIEQRLIGMGIYSPERKVKRGRNAGAEVGGVPYTRDNIRRLLQNRFYRGEVVWGQRKTVRDGDDSKKTVSVPESDWIIRPHSMGALVDLNIWDEAQRAIDLRLNSRERGRKYPVRLLDGLVQCGRCGRGMYARKRGHGEGLVFDYHCGGKYEVYSTCVLNHAVPENWLLRSLVGEDATRNLVSYTPRLEVAYTVEREVDTVGPELKALEAKAGELVADLVQIEKMTIKGFYAIEVGMAKQEEKRAEQAVINLRRDELLATPRGTSMTKEAPEAVRGLLALMLNERLPVEQRRNELRQLLGRVVVDRPSVRFVLREDGVKGQLQA